MTTQHTKYTGVVVWLSILELDLGPILVKPLTSYVMSELSDFTKLSFLISRMEIIIMLIL